MYHYRITGVVLIFVIASFVGNVFGDPVEKQQMTVTIADAGINTTVCSPIVTINANFPQTDEVGLWSVISGSGSFLNSSNPTTIFTASTSGILVLQWTITNTITSDFTSDQIDILNNSTSTAQTEPDKYLCTNKATIIGNPPAISTIIGTGAWSIINSSATITSPNLRTTTVNGLNPGLNVFLWTVSQGACHSYDTLKIGYIKSNAGFNQTVCGTSALLQAQLPVSHPNISSSWDLPTNSATIPTDSLEYPVIKASNLENGNNVFRWNVIVTGIPGCPLINPSNVTITSNMIDVANAGVDQALCTDSVFLSLSNPTYGTGTWSLIAGGGQIVNSVSGTTLIKRITQGINKFEWKITKGFCSSKDTISLINNQPTVAKVLFKTADICNDSIYLRAQPLVQGTGVWRIISGSGTLLDSTSNNCPAKNLSNGVTKFVWETRHLSCSKSHDTLIVTKNIAVTADAGPRSLNICNITAVTFTGNSLAGIGAWRKISGAGITSVINSTQVQVSNINTVGTTIYEWSLSIAGCSVTKDSIDIVRRVVGTANAGISKNVCIDSTNIGPSPASTMTGVWKVLLGTAILSDSTTNNTIIHNLQNGVNIMQWKLTSGFCQSLATVTITGYKPSKPLVFAPRTICSAIDTLKADTPTYGIGNWMLKSGAGTITGISANNATSLGTNLGFGTNVFYWTITNGPCTLADSTKITNQTPTIANAGKDSVICTSRLQLYANIATQGLGTWSLLSGSGTLSGVNASTTTILGLGYGANVLRWSISSGICATSNDIVTITNKSIADPNAGNDTCIIIPTGTMALVNLRGSPFNSSNNETGLWNSVSPGIFTFNPAPPSVPQVNVSISGTGFYRFVWRIDNGFCTARDTMKVGVLPTALPTTDQCIIRPQGSPFVSGTLVGQSLNSGSGEIGRWSFVSSSNPTVPSINSVSGVSNDMHSGVHNFRYTISNTSIPTCISSINKTVRVLSKAVAGLASGQQSCISSSNTGLVEDKNPVISSVGAQGFWTATGIYLAVGGYPTGNVFNLQSGINKLYLRHQYPSSTCVDNDSVTITFMTRPQAGSDTFLLTSPVNGLTQLRLNANSPNRPVGETSTWSAITSLTPLISFDTVNSPRATVRNLSPGVHTLGWRITNTINGCTMQRNINLYVQTPSNAGSNIGFSNPNPSNPLSTILSAISIPVSARGERGVWTFVGSNTISKPTPASATTTSVNLSNLRRGVHHYKYTISNINFPASVSSSINSSDVYLTIMTKAIALSSIGGGNLCALEQDTVLLGRGLTVPIKPTAGEVFRWQTTTPGVTLLQQQTDSIPVAKVVQLPVGKTKILFTITNTITGFANKDSLVVTNTTKPNAGINDSICSLNYVLNPPSFPKTTVGESFSWRQIYGRGIMDSIPGYPIVSVVGIRRQNNLFVYQIRNGTCKAEDTLRIYSNKPDSMAISGVGPNTCNNTNKLTGNDPLALFATAKSKWKIVSQPPGNTAQFGNGGDSTNEFIVTEMVKQGPYLIEYIINNENCILNDTVKITKDSTITIQGSGVGYTICGNTFLLTVVSPVGNETGVWSIFKGGALFPNLTNPQVLLTNIGTGTNGFRWNVTNASCFGSIDIIVENNIPPNSAIIEQLAKKEFCEKDTIYLKSYNYSTQIGNPRWSVLDANGQTFSQPNARSTLVNNLVYGNNRVMLEISNGVCPTSRDTVEIRRDQKPANINAGPHRNVCGDSIYLSAATQSVGIGKWKSLVPPGLFIQDSLANKTIASNLAPRLYSFLWKVNNKTCSDSSVVNYDVRPAVTTAVISTENLKMCDTATIQVQANTPTVGRGKWASLSTGIIFNNDSIPNPKAIIKNYGSNMFAWTITKDFCISSDTIEVTNYQPPTRAILPPDTFVCSAQYTLVGNIPSYGTPKWISSDTNIRPDTVSSSVITVAGLKEGDNKFIYEIFSLGCPSSYDTMLVINRNATLAFAGRDTIICTNYFTLNANIPKPGVGTWEIVEGGGRFEDIELHNSVVTSIPGGTNLYKWTIINGDCPPTSAYVSVMNNQPPILQAFQDKTVYTNHVVLEASLPSNGIGNWITLRGSGVVETLNSNISKANNLSVGENIFRWTVSNMGCDSVYVDQKVIQNDLTIPTGFSPNNDDFNQKFEITGISEYPNAKLEVFNRWGKQVYLSTNYKNDWEGTNNKQEDLVSDTYYYVLSLPDGRINKGYVVIAR